MAFVDWNEVTAGSFAVQHTVKVLLLSLAIYGSCGVLISAWRLVGGRGRAPMHNFLGACTPAEFWRRYNRLVGQQLECDVYRPMRRRLPAPVAIMIVFAISGIVHEYVFGVATGGPWGWQMAFFLVQGVGVAATARLDPTGWRRWVAWAVTIAFMLASTTLFMVNFNEIVPFYTASTPFQVASGN
jgi:hypothetical protein